MSHRFWKPVVASILALFAFGACAGDETPVKTKVAEVSAPAQRWAFVDAFAALKSADPARRLEAVEWIGDHLGTHPMLAKDALRAATADEDAEVASRARAHLRALGVR